MPGSDWRGSGILLIDERGEVEAGRTMAPGPATLRPAAAMEPDGPTLFKYEGRVWFFRTIRTCRREWWLAGDGVNHRMTAWADGPAGRWRLSAI
jgi:hypothetical protein